ncbi:hypothetical protein FH972_019971 [Carpinus fangiana]|uniref:Uncharacterized protein n=1 Tax=Carpinus fangiana TaxID=176857 RepID=A0A5N6RTB5_9ROSI|nr:hypothetical protein FH972_019971 [Carpinus fangiana]
MLLFTSSFSLALHLSLSPIAHFCLPHPNFRFRRPPTAPERSHAHPPWTAPTERHHHRRSICDSGSAPPPARPATHSQPDPPPNRLRKFSAAQPTAFPGQAAPTAAHAQADPPFSRLRAAQPEMGRCT